MRRWRHLLSLKPRVPSILPEQKMYRMFPVAKTKTKKRDESRVRSHWKWKSSTRVSVNMAWNMAWKPTCHQSQRQFSKPDTCTLRQASVHHKLCDFLVLATNGHPINNHKKQPEKEHIQMPKHSRAIQMPPPRPSSNNQLLRQLTAWTN